MRRPGIALLLILYACVCGCKAGGDESQTKAQSDKSGGGVLALGGDWKDKLADVTGGMMLGAEKGALFYAYDTLAYPARPVDLAARLQSVKGLSGISDVTISFYEGSKVLAKAKTDKDGLASVEYTPPKAGTYEFKVKITAVDDDDREELLEVSAVPLLVAAHAKEAPLVVIDLDHTVVDSSFFRVLVGGAKRMSGSRTVSERLAKSYGIVYLTHRPDILTVKSKKWLKENGFPKGPLLVSQLKQAFGDSGTYKSGRLSDLRKSYPNVKIGIGDKLSDAQAYIDNELTAYLIPHYKRKVKDMREMADQLREMRGRGRLQVVRGWREIEDGIFKGKSFPAKDFADRLEKEADKMEEEEEREEEEDDD